MLSTILIIEDELSLQNIIAAYFKRNEYTVITASNGLDGLEKFRKNQVDIVCCDVMMPSINGWDVVKSIRQNSNVPIIMMTALDSEKDQLKGFELEVDDYITKPFSPAVLVAKVGNLLKRINNKDTPTSGNLIKFENLEINMDSRTIRLHGNEIHVSKTEFDLLVFLMKNKGIVLDRVTILDEVWGMDVYVEERVVDTNIKVLRKKLREYSKNIHTVFGIGYKFDVEN
ncbi:MAG: response regulator transcription factor [Bacilli bacterium]|nr:response regulator transcription factor [Bacilli bacterium]